MLNRSSGLYTHVIGLIVLSLLAAETFAQEVIAAKRFEVTTNKTSSIIFPYKISEVDRGSRDILVQKAKGVTNVLKVKAGKLNFKETNLTVITDDGTIYLFPMYYAAQPRSFSILASEFSASTTSTAIFLNETTTSQLKEASEKIVSSFTGSSVKSTSDNDMKLSLLGIYIQENTLFYHVRVSNDSNIPFHTDMLRFYVKDIKKPKRTASQEVIETPIYHYGNPFVIKGKSSEEMVYALPKFTIPDAKVLTVELMEKKGGRHLLLKVKNKSILKAKEIPAV